VEPSLDRAPARSAVDLLTASLRSAAVRAADAVGGGVVLLYAGDPGGLRLRTATGFASPEAARSAGEALAGQARNAAMERAQPVAGSAVEALGPRGAGGVVVAALCAGERCLGALVVGCPAEPGDDALQGVGEAASQAAYRLDHVRMEAELTSLRAEFDGLRGTAHEHARTADEKSDEILKLSEQLFAQDIQLLQNNEKLGKIEKLKNDFIEKMSRELRTPLNSIIEAIISVLAGENDALSEGAKQSMRLALDEGTAFLRTLQNILDLWRIKQGELPVEIQEVNFREVVDEAIFSVQDTLGEKPVAIQKEFIEPFPKLRTDLAKINQILFLALDNAAKFTERGSIQVRSSVEDGKLVCELADTGIGICPDDQQFVFDEFYQVDELNSGRYRGSGLGLALVRDLLVLMDGTISLNSDVGRGSTFRFSIPVQIIG
jgi:signal transduction histidine kinase